MKPLSREKQKILVENLLAGSTTAKEQFCIQYYFWVRRCTSRWERRLPKWMTYEDAVQESYLLVLKQLNKWDSTKSGLTTFIYHTIKWYLVKRYSAKKYREELIFDSDIVYKTKEIDEERGAVLLNKLHTFAKTLKPKQKDTLIGLLEGESLTDIAKRCGVCREAIRQRKEVAIKKFKETDEYHLFEEVLV